MLTFAPNIAAILLYAIASAYLSIQVGKLQTASKPFLLSVAAVAVLCHGIGIAHLAFSNSGVNLSFFIALSLVACVINAILTLSSLRLPVVNLFLFTFPLAVVVVIATLVTHSPASTQEAMSFGLLSHITLSILAYALLTISALHALLLAWQNRQLRNKQMTGRVRLLPPLQTMETLLFDIIWAGQITLTLSILSGFVFLEDMFAQHLVHKTVLSLLAWVIYSVLLFGRHRQGWRGNGAIRWTLAGFCTLMLAYFGSKMVIELILGN